MGDERRAISGAIGPVVELLKVLLKTVSEEHGVAAKIIATTDDLEQLAQNDNAAVPALQGWRRDLFGANALALKHGQLMIGLKDQKVFVDRVAR